MTKVSVMNTFECEKKAYEALTSLMEQAEGVCKLFAEADLPLPPRIDALLSNSSPNNNPQGSHAIRGGSMTFNPLPSPKKPPNFEADWVWINVQDATPVTLTRAILESADGRFLRPKDIVDEIGKLNAELSSGGIYNVGPRLEDQGIIKRGEEGWGSTKSTGVPIIHDGGVWGPASVFQKQELAQHRRMYIKHILNGSSGGLQIMQIVNSLKQFDDCRAPINKDLVKADMNKLLEFGNVKRVGNSKKYVLIK